MVHYLFNTAPGRGAPDPARGEIAARQLTAGMWGVGPDEPHRDALAAGDVALVYVGAPERVFVAHVVIASGFHRWTTSEAARCPVNHAGGVLLGEVEMWDPPVSMTSVLSVMDPSQKARADFEIGVVQITAIEYATAMAVATSNP